MKIQIKPVASKYGQNIIDQRQKIDLLTKLHEKFCKSIEKYKCDILRIFIFSTIILLVSLIFYYYVYAVVCAIQLRLSTFSLGIFEFIDLNKTHTVDISWSNCGTSDYGLIRKLVVEPSPINLHKNLTLTFDAEVFQEISNPISLKVEVEKKMWITWVKIPCIQSVGSCTYQNICDFSPYPDNSSCPQPLENSFLPCCCPLTQHKYYVNQSVIRLKDPLKYIPNWLKNGKYRVKLRGVNQGKEVACYNFNFAVKS